MAQDSNVNIAMLSRVLIPQLFEYAGCVFARYVASDRLYREFKRKAQRSMKWEPDRTGVEAFENHFHTLDLFTNGHLARQTHSIFKSAESLGKAMALAWQAELIKRYQGQRFRIYYARGDNPTVRFHRVYKKEPSWLDEKDWEEDIVAGRILVLETPGRLA